MIVAEEGGTLGGEYCKEVSEDPGVGDEAEG